jgi:V/A-type H+-transporting ATPase subunit E
MTEQLQDLLARIQKDGTDKAEAEAERILGEARAKADALVRAAEKATAERHVQAERDAALLVERGRKALEQAARDVILTVGDAITRALQGMVGAAVGQALREQTLNEMLLAVVKAYCTADGRQARIDVLVPEAQQQQVRDFFLAQFRDALEKGVEIRGDSSLAGGFRIRLADGNVSHDFSQDAIADALCQLLRPQIAEIVRQSLPTGNDRPAPQR